MLRRIAGFGAADGIGRFLNWLLALVLAALLSPDRYGQVSLVIAVQQLAIAVMLAGQDRALLRFMVLDSQWRERSPAAAVVVWLVATLATAMALAAVVAILRLPDIWGLRVLPFGLVLLLALVAHSAHRLHLAFLRGMGDPAAYATVRIAFQVILLIVAVAVTRFFRDARGYVIALATAALPMLVLAVTQMRPRTATKPTVGTLLPLWRFGWPLTFHMLAGTALVHIDRFMLEEFLGRAEVGLYSAAYVVGSSVTMVYALVAVAFEPLLYERATRANQYLSVFANAGTAVAATMAVIIVGLGTVLGHYGRLGPYVDALPILPTILAAYVPHGIYMRAHYSLALAHRTTWIAGTTAGAATLNVALNYVLIPNYGLQGAAFATFVSYFCTNLALHVVAERRGGAGNASRLDSSIYVSVGVILILVGIGSMGRVALLAYAVIALLAVLGVILRQRG